MPDRCPSGPDAPAIADGYGSATLALLALGDGRFPVGGHAHSAGVESAVADGRVGDVESLEAFVVGPPAHRPAWSTPR